MSHPHDPFPGYAPYFVIRDARTLRYLVSEEPQRQYTSSLDGAKSFASEEDAEAFLSRHTSIPNAEIRIVERS